MTNTPTMTLGDMDNDSGWTRPGLWLAFLTGLTTLFAALVKVGEKVMPFLMDKTKPINYAQRMFDLHRVNETMESALEVGAQRVVIFMAHNDGAMPSPGSPFYTTAVDWKVTAAQSFSNRLTKTVRDYHQVRVDAAYIQMLMRLIRDGSVRINPDDCANTFLGGILKADNITDVLAVYLGVFGNNLYYMSFATTEEHFNEGQLSKFLTHASSVAATMRKYKS